MKRDAQIDFGPAVGGAAHCQARSNAQRSLFHAEKTNPAFFHHFQSIEPPPGIGHGEPHLVRRVFQDDSNAGRARMFRNILEALLQYPENAKLNLRRQPRRFRRDDQIDADAVRFFKFVDERFERRPDSQILKRRRIEEMRQVPQRR